MSDEAPIVEGTTQAPFADVAEFQPRADGGGVEPVAPSVPPDAQPPAEAAAENEGMPATSGPCLMCNNTGEVTEQSTPLATATKACPACRG